jgi:hypothetical protein
MSTRVIAGVTANNSDPEANATSPLQASAQSSSQLPAGKRRTVRTAVPRESVSASGGAGPRLGAFQAAAFGDGGARHFEADRSALARAGRQAVDQRFLTAGKARGAAAAGRIEMGQHRIFDLPGG